MANSVGVRKRKRLSESYADESIKAKGSNPTPRTMNVDQCSTPQREASTDQNRNFL